MKFKFLGTSAAEGFPAAFCDCEYCREARKRLGKSVRTRLQSLINDDLLIDFPADTYRHVLQNNLEFFKIKYLLITHSHLDHFCPEELNIRGYWFAPNLKEKITIVGSSDTYAKYAEFTETMQAPVREMIDFKVLEPFEKIKLGAYEITALPARHCQNKGFIYHIKAEGKNLLYAHDTGYFFDSVLEYINKNKTKFDFISFDCTDVELIIPDEGVHMGFENISRLKEVLKGYGSIDEKTVLYVNHFSHVANPLHEELCEKAAKFDLRVPYDGMEIEI